jgi:hypothetical protein
MARAKQRKVGDVIQAYLNVKGLVLFQARLSFLDVYCNSHWRCVFVHCALRKFVSLLLS